jgi:arginase
MALTRREFTMAAGAVVTGSYGLASRVADWPIALILAPSNLGLRPEGSAQPGTWRAPEVLSKAGLAQAVDAVETIALNRPIYKSEAQKGTRIRNGHTLREFSMRLSEAVSATIRKDRFPVVVGGDCGVLLGALYGARLAGARGLAHVDGHCDFFHPGNYDTNRRLGSVAGMDLALASGRGEPLLTEWPGVGKPLVRDDEIIQIGERDVGAGSSTPYDDILRTKITLFFIRRVIEDGIENSARRVIAQLTERGLDKVWLHVDFDVLDQAIMPAVDSPGSPGLNYEQLTTLVATLCGSGRVIGATFTIYDPDRDREARCAPPLVNCIADGVRGRAPSASERRVAL